MKNSNLQNAIPISPLLSSIETGKEKAGKTLFQKGRLIQISVFAIFAAIAISLIAKVLVSLINLVTNISFFGSFDLSFHSPATNHLGLWVIIIPVAGGFLVGLMALYGSKAIRGHGIPEAMEQILVNQSKIKPSITFLKPLSSAIAIGTGGPFGAEGPIIATGGALGSTLGQLFKITSSERKIILAAGATAGMSAIFGTPIAAIFLAVELLLFEFSPKSIIPVALACITGAAGHHLLFEQGPVFPMRELLMPSNIALAAYSVLGIIIGFISLGLTKIVYFIEDAFEKLPIHWMWWPAIGGLAVGFIGFFAPHTLGVGYDNITGILSGTWPLTLICSLCFFKFLSWAIALGSGTSGGTLAPLLTIGGAAGAIIGNVILHLFPGSDISVPMAALVGMSAMFAGASRAYLTSIVFALEATMQSHALLPLLAACTASYLISFLLMKNTIMTEKIARRGVITPNSYQPDGLQKMNVIQAISNDKTVLNSDNTIQEVKQRLSESQVQENFFITVNDTLEYTGTVKLSNIYNKKFDPELRLAKITQQDRISVKDSESLSKAVTLMARHNAEVLPVLSAANGKVVGVLSYRDVIESYSSQLEENEDATAQISLKRKRLKMLSLSKKIRKRSVTGYKSL